MSSRWPVDLEHLARQTAGDVQVEREALHLFVLQSAVYLRRLRAAIAERDRAEAAHTLKGSATAVGAWGVARLSEELEASPAPVRQLPDILADLESELEEIGGFVKRLYTEH
ncbi:Hpt domain-containing protein [Lutibaculum baratangense]|uniref:HPt domain-containing protein n=1 Tax=Lutibaculum baratangense AMV1 TaxID=631454 RepID=V4RKV0_9HYPH|nr:Hpt domain-containing protein [Lutibaculum baratangense]ESR26691.1 hypothetical protein N177_0475 [Lutibaculum baratangense AMV1]